MGYNQGRSNSGRQAPFATICAEVLDRILSNFDYHEREFDFTAYDVYLPFTLVNHHWYVVANRRLYLHVASGEAEDAEILLDTLRTRPDLAGTVRSINFGTRHFHREETEIHAAAIRLCHNLVALKLSGWNGFTQAPLVEAVRDAHTLKSISINRYGISDMEGDTFCSGLELLRMMHVWPGIEEVVICNCALSAEYHDDSTSASESDSNGESDDEPGSTPEDREYQRQRREIRARLKAEWKEERRVLAERRQFDQTTDWSNATPCLRDVQFSQISGSLDNTFLSRFATMAPNLQHFRADMLHALDGLRLCLRTWRHSLRTLRINTSSSHYQPTDGAVKWAGIDDAVPELTALQALAVSDLFVLPGTLRRCVAPIEYIEYEGSAEHMREVVGVLSSPDVLPTLRVFRTYYKDPCSELQTVLRARNVSVNPHFWHPGDDPRDRDVYGLSEPFEFTEKFLNYYGDNSESDNDGEEDSDSFDEDDSTE
ncbi:hypothetical protein FISHEDRAFT_68762 [Fistulina hepatica ATCC 64428]|uniref:F-box domain-containing protein n=1 Tax=Fistulina hepatica ATCC 64428 TaxID=1128425 RepID=A0A0D7AQE4_9AGAR|nr:hypothetical protein FISHEDRAFT_68762 [Fistulina hepatica ATCC 64428]